jgi:uncharacterized protein YdaU (DUF1376 family)
MHFYQFNPADFNNSARHLSLVERALYRDLIDMYYCDEQAIDASNMARLERRLLCRTQDEKDSLAYVLSEFFVKRGNKFHHHRIDREIKNYRYAHRNDGTMLDKVVTNDVTHTDNDVTHDVTMLDTKTRQQKAYDKVKNMVNLLKQHGIKATTRMSIGELQSLLAENNLNVQCDGVTHDVTMLDNDIALSDAKNAAITINQEPVTNNQDKNNTTPREQNFDIRDWVEPEYSDFIQILQDKEITMKLPQDLYLDEVEKFKHYNANLVAQGKASLVDENYRMTKFVDWFEILANNQRAAKQAVAAPVVHDDDLPEIYRQSSQSDQTYHPSHAPVAPAQKLPGMFSAYGQNYMPFDGMDAKATFEAVTSKMGKFYTFAEAYQVLKSELSGVGA